jgi:hypothetical protein
MFVTNCIVVNGKPLVSSKSRWCFVALGGWQNRIVLMILWQKVGKRFFVDMVERLEQMVFWFGRQQKHNGVLMYGA